MKKKKIHDYFLDVKEGKEDCEHLTISPVEPSRNHLTIFFDQAVKGGHYVQYFKDFQYVATSTPLDLELTLIAIKLGIAKPKYARSYMKNENYIDEDDFDVGDMFFSPSKEQYYIVTKWHNKKLTVARLETKILKETKVERLIEPDCSHVLDEHEANIKSHYYIEVDNSIAKRMRKGSGQKLIEKFEHTDELR